MSALEHVKQGQAAQQAGQLDEAQELYKAALELDLDNFAAAQLLGLLLAQRQDFAQAEIYLTHALGLNGADPITSCTLGSVQMTQGRPGDALLSYERALALKPDLSEAQSNRNLILGALKIAGQGKPAYSALGYFNLGFALGETKRFEAALVAYDVALALNPGQPYLRGARHDAKLQLCDWRGYGIDCADIRTRILQGQAVAWPFQIISSISDPALQRSCARNYVADQIPAQTPLVRAPYDHPRLRIAYLSSDFRNHPVGILIAGIIERHDRTKFECFGISTGADDASPWRVRLEKAFDRFLDARGMNNADIAAGIVDLEIDILIDLNGHTANARTGILALHPAPLQVNFLGYPGTMGADYVDYIIADRVLVPPKNEANYAEKIAAMPVSFQPNTERSISEHTPSRAECGLPEKGFVFCAFNSAFKITPDIFSVWMRLLLSVPGSVLWLRDAGPATRANLIREAATRRVTADRLVFAPPLKDIQDHLARHGQADLFLDTLHYNAHTTSSDALWSGLPVLTCPGRTYAARVSASLLQALGLADLIANSLEEYEALALKLAREPALLADIRTRLAAARDTSALFDPAHFTRDLEAAYRMMWERQKKGLKPESFEVTATADPQ